MILGLKGDKPKEYWDRLKTKEDLYNEFDGLQETDRYVFARNPEQNRYYKDGEFKAVANSMKDSVKVLLSVLPDITEHFTDSDEEAARCKIDAENILKEKFEFDRPDDIATFAWLVYMALDMDNVKSFYKRIESGDGIPEARAAYRAYSRYKAFKDGESARLEAFKKTPEYKMQAMELKLGLREYIELPEE